LVAVYDEKGNRIVGKDNIIREVQRRRAERDEWIREGKLENVFDEIHHTDDGWTSRVTFTAYPNQLHPNEVKAESERLLRIAEERSKNNKRKDRFLGDGVNSDTEETSDSEISSKKSNTGGNRDTRLMEVDKPENSLLLSDEQIAKANKSELTDLVRRISDELERRKTEQNSGSYQVVQSRLETQKQQAEMFLNSFLTSPDNSPRSNSNSVLPAVGVVGMVASLFAGLIIWKKNK